MTRAFALLLTFLVVSPVGVAALVGGAGGHDKSSTGAVPTASARFRSGVFDPPRAAPDFVLRGSDGSSVTLARYRGKVVLLEFGFTHCQRVCPTTLSSLGQAFKRLGASAGEVQLIFVTVDPKRDSPERLREYLQFFNPTFIGATGTSDSLEETQTQLDVVRRAYGIVISEVHQKDNPVYDVHHTSSVGLIDRQGMLRALIPFGKPIDDIVHDVQLLLEQ